MARMRAVEEGLPLVRAANTGISVVTDPYGRILARLGLGAVGVIDQALPEALPQPSFARSAGGLLLVALMLLAAAAAALVEWRGRGAGVGGRAAVGAPARG
jgi:apolipoprotein N-acyltransferase